MYLGCLLVLFTQLHEELPFCRSEAFRDLRLAGYEVIKESKVDLNDDGLEDAIVVEQSTKGVGFSAWLRMHEGGYNKIFRSEPVAASLLADLLPVSLDKSHRAWLLDVYEDSPDEEEHWLKLFLVEKQAMREIFSSSYQKSHTEVDAGRKPVRILDLGGMECGLKMEPQQEGWPVLRVRNAPKKIEHRRESREPVWVIIGMTEHVFAPRQGRYHKVKDRYLDFLPQVESFKITTNTKNVTKSVDSEGKSLPYLLSDQNLSTGWIAKGSARGQTLSMSFSRPEKIHMLRVVSFCEGKPESFNQFGRLIGFEIRFDDELPIRINREKSHEHDSRVELVEDFALPGSETGVQTLVFLSKPIRTRSIKLVVREVERRGGVMSANTCISEISMHKSFKKVGIGQKDFR